MLYLLAFLIHLFSNFVFNAPCFKSYVGEISKTTVKLQHLDILDILANSKRQLPAYTTVSAAFRFAEIYRF